MSFEGQDLETISCEATGAIAENRFVTLDSAYTGTGIGVKQAGAGDDVLGISVEAASAGDTVSVARCGRGKLIALGDTPGTITPGSRLKSDADGLPVLTTTALDNVGAIALEARDTEGDQIRVEITPHASVKAAS